MISLSREGACCSIAILAGSVSLKMLYVRQLEFGFSIHRSDEAEYNARITTTSSFARSWMEDGFSDQPSKFVAENERFFFAPKGVQSPLTLPSAAGGQRKFILGGGSVSRDFLDNHAPHKEIYRI